MRTDRPDEHLTDALADRGPEIAATLAETRKFLNHDDKIPEGDLHTAFQATSLAYEKKYGQPIAHWMKVLQQAGPLKHMELVNLLKAEHEMGHGHANALVASFLAKK